MKIPVLVRDIPIYEGWLEDGVNLYKAKDLEEFDKKISDILEGRLPSLVEEGYIVAKERDIKNIGKQLKQVYERVLNNSEINIK